MAEYTIDKFSYDGNTYKLQDNESGYVTASGAASAAPVQSVNGQTGTVTLTIPAADDHKWNDVELNKTSAISQSDIYVPFLNSTSSTTASLVAVISDTTGLNASKKIPKYNNSGYLVSTTPSANDNSTKVATTAYVDAAIPTNISSFTNDSGYLTLSTLPIYDGTVTTP